MMVYHTTEGEANGAFGLYGLSGKATAFLAPATVTAATVVTGNARFSLAPLIFLFLVGLVLLIWVKPEGERS